MLNSQLSPLLLLFVIIAIIGLNESATSISTSIDDVDRLRLKSVLSIPSPLTKLQLPTIYYAIYGQTLLTGGGGDLGVEVTSKKDELCKFLQSAVDETNLENLFFVTSSAKLINCQVSALI